MTTHVAVFYALAHSRTYTDLGEAFTGGLPKDRTGDGVLHVDEYVQARGTFALIWNDHCQ